jgi:hypothetical protein
VCEGSDETLFLTRLIRARGLNTDRFDLFDAGGKDKIPGTLSTMRNDPHWPRVQRLAVLRDADADGQAAFQSVRDTLTKAFGFAPSSPWLWTPPAPAAPSASLPSLAVVVVGTHSEHTGRLEGALETLCLEAVPPRHLNALQCAEALTRCAAPLNGWRDGGGHLRPASRSAHDKARFQAYLAARSLSGRLGLALGHTDDLIDFGHGAFDPLAQLLTAT